MIETRTELVEVPNVYLEPCLLLESNEHIVTTRDLGASRLDWRKAARECAALHSRFIGWYLTARSLYEAQEKKAREEFNKQYGKYKK